MKNIFILALLVFFTSNCIGQTEYKIKKNKGVIILLKGNTILDSLYFGTTANGFEKLDKNESHRVINQSVYEISKFVSAKKEIKYYVTEYKISNEKFIDTHTMTIDVTGCLSKRFKLKLTSKGICWRNKKHKKKYSDLILYSEFEKLEKYIMPSEMCSGKLIMF